MYLSVVTASYMSCYIALSNFANFYGQWLHCVSFQQLNCFLSFFQICLCLLLAPWEFFTVATEFNKQSSGQNCWGLNMFQHYSKKLLELHFYKHRKTSAQFVMPMTVNLYRKIKWWSPCFTELLSVLWKDNKMKQSWCSDVSISPLTRITILSTSNF